MTATNRFPPDAQKDWSQSGEEAGTVEGLKAKAADVADKVTGTVREGYERSMEAVSDFDARASGEAMMKAVERHPIMAFGLGALSVGLIAWASMRDSRSSYMADMPSWRRMFNDYGNEASRMGDGLFRNGRRWFDSSADQAHDYADQATRYARDGSRYLASQSEREPLAAIVGIGLAVYVLGSLLSSGSRR